MFYNLEKVLLYYHGIEFLRQVCQILFLFNFIRDFNKIKNHLTII